jgi:hypothetical protein
LRNRTPTRRTYRGAGNGYVSVFKTDGVREAPHLGGELNSPGNGGGPGQLGPGGTLLVGNFGDGTVNAYALTTGRTAARS